MKKINVAILGMGTVGSGLWKILNTNKDEITKKCGCEIEVSKVLVKDKNKKRDFQINNNILTTEIDDILNDDSISIVIELIGGEYPAKNYIIDSMKKGKSVVTANKLVVASHWIELNEISRQYKVNFLYEASVAGGIPILQSIKDSLIGNKIETIQGIVNGTTNFILTKMFNENKSFKSALKEAQDLGFAEADPTSDIGGFDAMYKLSILSSLSFDKNININSIYREGIEQIDTIDIEFAKELGYKIKLLAISKQENDTFELRVHPSMINFSHPLAEVNDSFNAVLIKGNAVGELMYYGRGAGDLPTGSAVVGDIIHIVKQLQNNIVEDSLDSANEVCAIPINEVIREYYIRMSVSDSVGILGKITTCLGNYGVSIEYVNSKKNRENICDVVFLTHKTKEGNLKNALDQFDKLNINAKVENIIRIEKH